MTDGGMANSLLLIGFQNSKLGYVGFEFTFKLTLDAKTVCNQMHLEGKPHVEPQGALEKQPRLHGQQQFQPDGDDCTRTQLCRNVICLVHNP